MKPPARPLEPHLDEIECPAWRDLKVDVERLYDRLTASGWKVDTEESNLMVALSKTWRSEGLKVWLRLQNFVCAPPYGEVERLDAMTFYRFDPALMPTGTMHDATYEPGEELADWYPRHREEWDWLIEHGDPQSNTHDLLTAIALREVPPALLRATWDEIEAALELVE